MIAEEMSTSVFINATLNQDYNALNTLVSNISVPPVYEYDSDILPELEELIPVSIVYGITLIVGIIGNILVIFSVTKYELMMTITNTFLLSLATADLLLVLICVPVKFAAFFSYIWRFGEFLCKTVHYIQNVSAICSVTTLTSMSLERYYAIVHPMKAKYTCTVGKTRRAIVLLWLLSFFLAFPILIGRVQITVGIHRQATWCVKEWRKPVYAQIYEVYMFCLLLLIPVGIMTFAYCRICQELWFMSRDRPIIRNIVRDKVSLSSRTMDPPSALKVRFTEDDKTRKQVIKMLVTIIVVFALCWAPITINNVLVAFDVLPELHIGIYKYMREAFHVMSYANSCVNPVVYGFMSKNFRQTFKRALCSCLRGRQYIRQMTFRTQTEIYVDDRWGSGATKSEDADSIIDLDESTQGCSNEALVKHCLDNNV